MNKDIIMIILIIMITTIAKGTSVDDFRNRSQSDPADISAAEISEKD